MSAPAATPPITPAATPAPRQRACAGVMLIVLAAINKAAAIASFFTFTLHLAPRFAVSPTARVTNGSLSERYRDQSRCHGRGGRGASASAAEAYLDQPCGLMLATRTQSAHFLISPCRNASDSATVETHGSLAML